MSSLKKILVVAGMLTAGAFAMNASQAEAGYGYGYRYFRSYHCAPVYKIYKHYTPVYKHYYVNPLCY